MINLPLRAPEPSEPPPIVDVELVRRWLGFTFHAVKRHRLRALAVFALVAGTAGLALWGLPRNYHVEAKLLAQPNLVMPALGNPGRAIPGDADEPTRAASETVMRRENLVELIRATNLVDEWEQRRAPALRLKDALIRMVKGQPKREEKIDALVGLLEKRLLVYTSDRTVNIVIDWPDAEMAYRIVDAAQQNFLEARHASEVASITEAIEILQSHADTVRGAVDEAYDNFRNLQRNDRQAGAVILPPRPRRTSPAPPPPSREVEQLKAQLAAKQRAATDLEDFRKRRLSELQSDLASQRATYGPRHPVILALQQSIDQLQQESPQLSLLKQDIRRLEAEIAERLPSGSAESRSSLESRDRPRERDAYADRERDRQISPGLELAEERLRAVQGKYDELQGRIDSARIELDTARAAFKYRYSVVTPAQIPRRPTRPNVPVGLVAGIAAGLLLAIISALHADLAGGRITEPWQLEHALHVPVLAEVSRP